MLELIFFLVDLQRKMRLSTGVAVYWLLNTIMDVKVKHNNNKTSKGCKNSEPMQSTNKVIDEPKKVVVLLEVKRVLLHLLLFLLRLRFKDIRRRREWHDELVRVDGGICTMKRLIGSKRCVGFMAER